MEKLIAFVCMYVQTVICVQAVIAQKCASVPSIGF